MKQLGSAVCASVAALCISGNLSAKTLTWNLDVEVRGSFLEAASWKENAVPEPGDTIVVDKSGSSWNKHFLIGRTGESFDFGDKGLTFRIDSNHARFMVNFTGTGKITKTGTGSYGVDCDSGHTGGTDVLMGVFQTWGQYSFGTAPIKFIAADGAKPRLGTDKSNVYPKNAVVFTGSGYTGEYSMLETGQAFTFYRFTSDHDGFINAKNVTVNFNDDVEMPGRTLALKFMSGGTTAPNFTFAANKNIDVSICHLSGGKLTINGICTNVANNLLIENGPCVFGTAARWAGTNVVLKSTAGNLSLASSQNLGGETSISIENDAKINISSGVEARIRSLTVKGMAVPSGHYSKADLPAVIDGDGVLSVGMGKRTTWIGGLTGGIPPSNPDGGTPLSIFDSANWDNGVPVAGDTLVFTNNYSWWNSVYVGLPDESLDIGEKGIAIETVSHLKLNVKLTGRGSVVKTGAGTLGVSRDSEHAGGTRILGGKFESFIEKLGFGTGPVALVAGSGNRPALEANLWGRGITNAIIFAGEADYTVSTMGQLFDFDGDVLSEHDFTLKSTFGGYRMKGTVSAPGKTLTVDCSRDDDKSPPHVYCEKSVDANVVKLGNKNLYLKGASTNPANSLTIRRGSCVVEATGSWAGTNVVVESTAISLALKNNASLSSAAVVRIATTDGAKIDVAKNVKVGIAELWVDGVRLPDRTYSAQTLPSAISGGGRLKVGNAGMVLIYR